MKPLWIKWYPVNWLHSTARDEMNAAQRSTFQDFVCLAAISKTPGSFKFVNAESLSRMLNTDVKTIEETIKVCFDRKRISIREDAEGMVMKILKWKVYQSFASVDNKTEKTHNNVNDKVDSSSHLLSNNSSSDLRGGVGGHKGESGFELEANVSVLSKSRVSSLIKEIIFYLNEKAGRNYLAESASIKDIIAPRLKEGRTVDEFKKIIDLKVAKWGGDPKMDDFLRPSTLFRKSHFDEYLNEKPNPTRADDFEAKLDAWAAKGDKK
jgi:uncharacterized phage protein (TIGR02220 family)